MENLLRSDTPVEFLLNDAISPTHAISGELTLETDDQGLVILSVISVNREHGAGLYLTRDDTISLVAELMRILASDA